MPIFYFFFYLMLVCGEIFPFATMVFKAGVYIFWEYELNLTLRVVLYECDRINVTMSLSMCHIGCFPPPTYRNIVAPMYNRASLFLHLMLPTDERCLCLLVG